MGLYEGKPKTTSDFELLLYLKYITAEKIWSSIIVSTYTNGLEVDKKTFSEIIKTDEAI